MAAIKRKPEVLVHSVQEELVVYDTEGKKAHLLNETARKVWDEVDGERSSAEIAGSLGLDESVVALALDDLANADLLASVEPLEVSRRSALRTAASAAAIGLLLPAVTSIPAPLAGQVLSEGIIVKGGKGGKGGKGAKGGGSKGKGKE